MGLGPFFCNLPQRQKTASFTELSSGIKPLPATENQDWSSKATCWTLYPELLADKIIKIKIFAIYLFTSKGTG